MADPTFASDVPNEWRRGFISSYYAQHGTWPGSSMIEAEYARAWIIAEHGPWDRANDCYADGTRAKVALAEYNRHRRASRSSDPSRENEGAS